MNKYILLQEILRKMHEQQDKYPLIHDVSTPFSLVEEMIDSASLSSSDTIFTHNIEFAIALIHKYNVEPKRITIFADVCPTTETFAAKLGINYIDAWNYNMKFDVVFANPPYNSKNNIHFRMMPMFEKIVKDNGTVSLIIPKNMFNQSAPRAIEYCSWLYSMDYAHFNEVDMEAHFPSVGDVLVWFTAINNNESNCPDFSPSLPDFKFNATRVVGIDFGNTSKVRSELHNTPLICGVGANGDVRRNRYATTESLKKLSSYRGKPTLHINTHGATVEFNTIAYLDESGDEYWFRQGLGSFVFEDLDEARRAAEWFNGSEFKSYLTQWKTTGWFFKNNIEAIFRG